MQYVIIGTDMASYHNNIKQTLKDKMNIKNKEKLSNEDKDFLMRAILHMADISNPLRPFDNAKQWAIRIQQEFFNQGDIMREMKLEISQGCDRYKITMSISQQNFLEYCVIPMATSLSYFIEELKICVNNAINNKKLWNESNKELK